MKQEKRATTATSTTEVPVEKKPVVNDLSLQATLKTSGTALEIAFEDKALQDGLVVYGYDQIRIQEGKVIWQEAKTSYYEQLAAYDRMHVLVLQMRSSLAKATKMVTELRKIARILFKADENTYKLLRLDGKIMRRFQVWWPESNHFCSTILADTKITDAFLTFNKTREQIVAVQDMIEQTWKLSVELDKTKALAQKATEDRDLKFDRLSGWMSDFFKIARLAFADDAIHLLKLGLSVSR